MQYLQLNKLPGKEKREYNTPLTSKWGYSDRCEAEGIVFFPVVVDTFGGWHKDSLEVITKLGRQVSRQTGKEEEEIVRQLQQRVAVLLVRDNVNMFDSRTPTYPQAVVDADVDIDI